MVDSATDSSMIEEIYLWLLVAGEFLSLKSVAKADAAGIKSAVVKSLENNATLNFGTWKSRLIGFGADGVGSYDGTSWWCSGKAKGGGPSGY